MLLLTKVMLLYAILHEIFFCVAGIVKTTKTLKKLQWKYENIKEVVQQPKYYQKQT